VHIHRRIGLRDAIAATLPEKRASCCRLRQRRILTHCNYATYAHKSKMSAIGALRRFPACGQVIHKGITATRRLRDARANRVWTSPHVSQALPNAGLGKQRIAKTSYFIGFLSG
jgi:hypothetical protein